MDGQKLQRILLGCKPGDILICVNKATNIGHFTQNKEYVIEYDCQNKPYIKNDYDYKTTDSISLFIKKEKEEP